MNIESFILAIIVLYVIPTINNYNIDRSIFSSISHCYRDNLKDYFIYDLHDIDEAINDLYDVDEAINPKYRVIRDDFEIMNEILAEYKKYLLEMFFGEKFKNKKNTKKLFNLNPKEFFFCTFYDYLKQNDDLEFNGKKLYEIDSTYKLNNYFYSTYKLTDYGVVFNKLYYFAAFFCTHTDSKRVKKLDIYIYPASLEEIEARLNSKRM